MAYIYRVHALQRMFQRDISEEEVEQTVAFGEIIENYPDDQPYPSRLVLGHIGQRAIHVLHAIDEKGTVIVITVYEPAPEKWHEDHKTRKK